MRPDHDESLSLMCMGTWCTPGFCVGLWRLLSAQGHVPIPSCICENGVPSASRTFQCFLLSFVTSIRYKYVRTTSPVPTWSSVRFIRIGGAMTFEEILDQAIAMLQRRGRLTYSTLKRQFQLDDAALNDVKNELIEDQRLAVDEQGNVLVWTGGTSSAPPTAAPMSAP